MAILGLDRGDVLVLVDSIIATLFIVALLRSRLKVDILERIVPLINTKGGLIILLGMMSIYFFHQAMHLIYVLLSQIQAGTLREDNAIALMGVQFATGTAFGSVLGAMLKTATGEEPSKTTSIVTPSSESSATTLTVKPDLPGIAGGSSVANVEVKNENPTQS